MNHSSSASSTSVSSQTGREWLRGTARPISSSPGEDQKSAVVLGAQPLHQVQPPRTRSSSMPRRNNVHITSVSIPDVSAVAALSGKMPSGDVLTDPKAIAKSLEQASDEKLNQLSQPFADLHFEQSGPVASMTRVAAREAEPSVSSEATSSTTQSEVAMAKRHRSDAQRQTEIKSDPVDSLRWQNQAEELESVVQSIFDRQESGQPLAIMFTGSEANPHIDSTSATVAAALARQSRSRVLLIDSNASSQELSRAGGALDRHGLGDILTDQRPWEDLICKGAASGVDFLPLGQQSPQGQRFHDRLQQLVEGLKAEYTFVCVAAGPSEAAGARLWSDIADGCYLLVSQKHSNPELAKSTVAELRSCGARLLGCVVTDAEL